MKVAAIGGATLAADSGSKTVTKLVPYVNPPEWTPVDWQFVATTCRECPAGCGMHIWHRDGRVTKAEGNREHPVNRGGLCARGQSALQGVYDPDRIAGVLERKRGESDWKTAFAAIGERLQKAQGRVALMSRLETGTVAEIMDAFTGSFGSNRLLLYEAFNYEPLRKAHGTLLGEPVIPYYRLDQCDYILSFGADFLETWVSNVQFAWQYASMHELKNKKIGRFDYVGPRLSMTAANADRFVLVPPGKETDVALALLRIMLDQNLVKAGRNVIAPLVRNVDFRNLGASFSEEDLTAMAKRLASGRSVALAGPIGVNGPGTDRLALVVTALNIAAGSIGPIMDFSRSHALSNTATEEQIDGFLKAITKDDILIIHKTNPVYSRPGSEESIKKAGLVVYLGTLRDETANLADWILPVNEELESWGDYEPWAGIHGIIQATTQSVADTGDAGDVLIKLAASAGKVLKKKPDGSPIETTYDWLQQRWQTKFPQAVWIDSLRRGGFWPGSGKPGGKAPALKAGAVTQAAPGPIPQLKQDEALLWLWASVMLFDGRTANRGWIQEAPEPVSTVMWTNWIDIHTEKAKQLGINDGDILSLTTVDNHTIQAPARVTLEIAESAVAICYGQGHTAMGENAVNIGGNAFQLLPKARAGEAYFGRVTIKKTGKSELVRYGMTTKEQHDRDLHQWVDLETAKTMKPGPLKLPLPETYGKETDLYRGHVHNYHRWVMTIDLQRCIGCGACAVACYAENNLSVVGREGLSGERGVLKSIAKAGVKGTNLGRIMAWLRIVPYRHEKDPLRVGFLPMPCQHCDSAPCEPVCPVFAAVNNEEGLNAQIYNRCIGTRYCSNNCPYKVRRFNWLNTYWKPPLDLQLNPEVTVRCRGVMEKCTFCIQRIRNAEYRAKRENRKVRDGEIQPACVQSCPTRVYEFGDLRDPNSVVSKITRENPRRYHVLEELNTKPAVTYLFRILQEDEGNKS